MCHKTYKLKQQMNGIHHTVLKQTQKQQNHKEQTNSINTSIKEEDIIEKSINQLDKDINQDDYNDVYIRQQIRKLTQWHTK